MQTLNDLDNFAAHLEACSRPGDAMVLRSFIAELRRQFEPTGSPFDESAPANSQHFKTWVAIMDALDGSGFDWRPRTPQTCAKDAAVAAIRSMAAQCSAQPAPDYARPLGLPAIRREQIDALVFANGFMYAKGHEPIADQLAALVGWLRTNAPQE